MSEMMGADLSFKVPLSWEGEVRVETFNWGAHEQYVVRTVRMPQFEWFEAMEVTQPEGATYLECSWSGELNYGWYDSDGECLLEWLRNHRVPYLASCDAKYEFDGSVDFYNGNPEGDVISRTSSNAGVTLDAAEWRELVDASGKDPNVDPNRWLVGKVDEHFAAIDLDGCDISHLPEDPPEEDDEDDH